MDIKISGFELRCDGSIDLSDFFDHLLPLSGQQFGNEIFGIVDKGSHYVGIMIIIKDMKAFLTKKNLGEKITISAESVADNEEVVVANFFLIDKSKFRGLYSIYYGSCTLNKYLYFLNSRFRNYKNELIETEINNAGEPKDQKDRLRIENNAKKKHTGHLKYAILERKEALEKRILQLRELKNFTFEHLSLDSTKDEFLPISKNAKRISHSVTFEQSNPSQVKQSVINAIKAGSIFKGTVKGTDPNGLEVVYKMFHDYDVFERYDYNDIIKSVSLDLGDLETSIKSSKIVELLELSSKKPLVCSILTA